MKIIKNSITELSVMVDYDLKREYSDGELNSLYNNWCLFDEKEQEIQNAVEVTLETVLYSKYYWCSQYIGRFNELYGDNAGLDQQQYKIIEEIEQKTGSVDWELIRMVEEYRE